MPSSAIDRKPLAKPTSATRSLIIGLLVVVIGIGGALYWAFAASLSSGAYAPGRLRVESQSKQVQHLEGGIVAGILVKEGDQVKNGDVLIQLDTIEIKAGLAMNRAALDSALARQARMTAELAESDEIAFPQRLSDRHMDSRVARLLSTQRDVLRARREYIESQLVVYRQQIITQQERIVGLKFEVSAAGEQLKHIGTMLKSEESLKNSGYTTQKQLLELRKDRAQIRQNRAETKTAIRTAEAQVLEIQSQVIAYELTNRKEVLEQLEELQQQIPELEERTIAAKMRLQRTKVRAPTDGEVVGLKAHTVGGVISPREPIMSIVPKEERLVIEAQVTPEDVERVQQGHIAAVRFTSLNTRTTPVLLGSVKTISADLLTDPTTGAPYFAATVVISAEQLDQLWDQKLVPGMPVDVIIEGGKRTPFEYMVKPLTDVMARAFLE